jgi:predicted Zn-dependent protease
MVRLAGVLFAAISVLAHVTASAQTALAPPREVVLYVHQELENADFVDLLVCELSRTLVAPVRAQPITLPLDIGLMASPTQFDSAKVARQLLQATAGDGDLRVFKFLLFPHDLRAGSFLYVFGSSFGLPYNNGIVSTARLKPNGADLAAKKPTEITVSRTYKVILRYVAHLSGMWASNGCVLAMPSSIDELDRKPAEFCDDDRAALVEAGIIKPHAGGICGPVAMTLR